MIDVEFDGINIHIPLSLPSLLYFVIQASHIGRIEAAFFPLQIQLSSAVSSSEVLLSHEAVRLTTGEQTSLHSEGRSLASISPAVARVIRRVRARYAKRILDSKMVSAVQSCSL